MKNTPDLPTKRTTRAKEESSQANKFCEVERLDISKFRAEMEAVRRNTQFLATHDLRELFRTSNEKEESQ